MSLWCLRARSPLHVGAAGDVVDATEFARVGDRLHRLSLPAVEDMLRRRGLVAAYLRAVADASGPPFSVSRFLQAQGLQHLLPELVAYAVDCPAEHPVASLRAFCRDPGGAPYIPGSTIKGALRTAVLADAVAGDPSLQAALESAATDARPSDRWAAQRLEGRTFQTARYPAGHRATDVHRDLWRFVTVGDSEPLDPEDVAVAEVQVWNLRADGSPYVKARLYVECLRPGAEARFGLRVDRPALAAAGAGGGLSEEGLVAAARAWAARVWEGERPVWSGLPAEVRDFYSQAPAGLRVAWGSGWQALGVGRLLPEPLQRHVAPRVREGLPYPKTRKLALLGDHGPLPLGWADLAPA